MFFILFSIACTEFRSEKFDIQKITPAKFEEIRIPKGEFVMGASQYTIDERPPHTVRLTHDFMVMKTEVTQELFVSVMLFNPSFFRGCGASCPVEKVQWQDVIEFANRLNESLGLEICYQEEEDEEIIWPRGYACTGWRLPTEAEWEYVAQKSIRGVGKYFDIAQHSWFEGNSKGTTHPVCKKKTSFWGICDIVGNVQEWVWDPPDDYQRKYLIDPITQAKGHHRSFRGGAWNRYEENNNPFIRKEANELFKNNDLGFRLVRTISE